MALPDGLGDFGARHVPDSYHCDQHQIALLDFKHPLAILILEVVVAGYFFVGEAEGPQRILGHRVDNTLYLVRVDDVLISSSGVVDVGAVVEDHFGGSLGEEVELAVELENH